MDISRVANEQKLNLCRWYFRGKAKILLISFELLQFLLSAVGFAFLPFVWLINFIWFFNTAFKKDSFEEQDAIRKCK